MINNIKSDRMNTRYILLIALFLISFRVSAQPPETTYLGNIAKAGYADQESYGPFNIGFSFTFYGNVYSQFYISSNGMITFGTGSINGTSAHIPSGALPNNYIAPFWDDLVVDPSGKILYTTIGSVGNRKLIVQFSNMGFYPFPVFMGTFQAILHETTNLIQVQYRLIVDANSTKAHGSTATIGLENADGTSGVEYAYHNATAIAPEQAISFTPSGSNYTVNANSVYDGIFLTTNLTLPEPGITKLVSPPGNAVIGSSHTFAWAAASNAASYKLYISNNSDLSGATSYTAGANLTYDITGLTLNATYYWGVFSSNATGTSWCEIQKFTTSSAPPLTPVPQTIWTEQLQDKTIRLQYSGGDASPKTIIITSLPVQGQLYQYNAGARGSLISSVPATVTDPSGNVIYAATGSAGNSAGNFNFKINDAGGDSPAGTITINVSLPGVPILLYVAKNANVEMQFDITMADPSGKQNQFTVKVNGTPVSISSSGLKTGDPYTILLTLAAPLSGTETILVSYAQGDVTGTNGGSLLSFTDQPVSLTAQTINFSQSLSKKLSEASVILTASASSGLALTYSSSNLAVATASGNVLTFHSVGTSDITARQAGNATYAPAKYIKTLSVTKTDQTITFNALPAKSYGDADFSPGATASSGLPVSYSSDNLSVATIVGNMIHITGAGSAIITASQAGDGNYGPAPAVLQTLTVAKIAQTITFSGAPVKLLVKDSYTLVATSTSGLTVLFESMDPQKATVTGNQLTGVSKGDVQIRAYNTGNQNYNAAEVLVTVEIYSTHKDIMYLFTPNNDGFNDLWELPDLATWGKCDVRIFNRWGKLVYANENYNNLWDGTSNGSALPEGAYYFVIKTENAGNKKGTVNIVR
jgi:gliding motility-associated-like protein